MLFDSIFDIQRMLKKIGVKEFINEIKKIDSKSPDKNWLIAESALVYLVENLDIVYDDIYSLISKETTFEIEQLKKMNSNEVFSLLQEIFKDGIPDIILKEFKKKTSLTN